MASMGFNPSTLEIHMDQHVFFFFYHLKLDHAWIDVVKSRYFHGL